MKEEFLQVENFPETVARFLPSHYSGSLNLNISDGALKKLDLRNKSENIN